MGKWKRLGAASVAVVVTLSVVTVATQSTANANPDNPTFISAPFGKVTQARAYNVAAAGFLAVSPTTDSKCNPGQTKDASVASVTVQNVLKLNALTTHCSVSFSGNSAVAEAKAADVDLFNGKIRITALDAYCFRNGGYATVGATYGSLVTDQNYSHNGSGAIILPGLATVAVNVKGITSKSAFANLIVITLLNQQVIVISACELKHQSFSLG